LGVAIGRRRSVINMTPERPASWQDSEVRAVQRRLAAADTAADDWDLLFRAVLDLLARASKANPATECTSVQLKGHPKLPSTSAWMLRTNCAGQCRPKGPNR
jgi:hypothetical protein